MGHLIFSTDILHCIYDHRPTELTSPFGTNCGIKARLTVFSIFYLTRMSQPQSHVADEKTTILWFDIAIKRDLRMR